MGSEGDALKKPYQVILLCGWPESHVERLLVSVLCFFGGEASWCRGLWAYLVLRQGSWVPQTMIFCLRFRLKKVLLIQTRLKSLSGNNTKVSPAHSAAKLIKKKKKNKIKGLNCFSFCLELLSWSELFVLKVTFYFHFSSWSLMNPVTLYYSSWKHLLNH